MLQKINTLHQIEELKNNYVKVEGKNISFEESEVRFEGENNLLIIEDNVKLKNTNIFFKANNGIVYISKSNSPISMDCVCSNDSVVFLGENIYINSYSSYKLFLSATERENIIIGDDCLFSYGICMRTADPHIVYDCVTKNRINLSKSILIGDHVWIGQNALILKGSKIGSGAIVGANSVVANKTIVSNSAVGGNPCKILRDNVFFSRKCVHNYLEADTLDSLVYDTEEYIYLKNNDNIDLEEFNTLLKKSGFEDRIKVIKEVLVNNSCKDRFYIG